ncbi:MAG TPA: extracellular solute-binding protein, partial [Euzebyales bacterium]|nr:extracellular solute-binding protein [Euzebyales bacterium]
LTNDDGTEYTLESEGMKAGLAYYQSLFEQEFSTTRTLNPGELEPGFADGTFGAFISGPWEIGLVRDAGVTDEQLAVAPLPGQESGIGTSFIGGGNLAVFADARNRDGAWKFVRWLAQPDVQSDWYTTLNDLPAVTAAWDSGELADDPLLAVFGEQLASGNAPPAVPTWEQVAAAIDRDVERVARGRMTVDEAVADMQQQAESIGTGL